MGIDLTGLRALSFAKRVYEFDFKNTVTLGRHEIHFWKRDYEIVQNHFGFAYDQSSMAVGGYCEPLLQKLGAENITSIDASAFEGASLVHDFSLPIPSSLHEQFDTFLDFGSVEHIFDVAQVVDNIVKLVRPGGHTLIATNANGFPSHGFFQYSPEFFYSVFSSRNGFQDTSVFVVPISRQRIWSFIRRPAELKRRNEIPYEEQMMVLVFSRKTGNVTPLTVFQSDYDDAWAKFETGSWKRWNRENISGWKKTLHGFMSPYLYRRIVHGIHSHQARRKFKAERILVDPDVIDPGDFRRISLGSVSREAEHAKMKLAGISGSG